MAKLPRLFYVCDFPPANRGGGDTLLLRLLEEYPLDSLFIAASHRRIDAVTDGPFRECKQLGIYEFTGKKRHGMAQFLLLLDRLLIPLHALRLAWHARRWKAQVVLTVAHGYLFLAAHLCAAMCRLPVVMIVHDDWVAMERYVRLFRPFLKCLFRCSLRRSSHIYAVSETMVAYLNDSYGVNASLQLPATFPSERLHFEQISRRSDRSNTQLIRVVYAGMIYDNVFASLDIFARYLLQRAQGANHDKFILQLHIHSALTQDQLDAFGWTAPVIRAQGWLPPKELRLALQAADILLLPVATTNQNTFYAATSFPSKLADYLAAGRPILLIGPEDAYVAQYLKRHRCAALVSTADFELIERTVCRILADSEFAAQLSNSSLSTFSQNHNIIHQRSRFYDDLCRTALPIEDIA